MINTSTLLLKLQLKSNAYKESRRGSVRDQGLLLSERKGLRVCTMKFQINMRELEHDYYAV